jgi:hypothetical protein
MDISDLTNAGLRGWPLAITVIAGMVCFVSFFCGWPWEGIIVHKHYHNGNEVEEPEDDENEE